MDDYIWLIIAVVISIFAAIKKNKKKENVVSQDPANKEISRNFLIDQILGEDFLSESEEDIFPSDSEMQVLKKEPMVVAMPSRNPLSFKSTYKSSLPERLTKSIPSNVNNNPLEILEEIDDTVEGTSYLEDFSLRKAVIYSEIMNRKYSW